MRLFDESREIKHPLPSMQLTRMLCVTFACLALRLGAQEQPSPPSASPPVQPPVQVPNDAAKTRVLTLEEVIKLALQHNLDIQITRFVPLFDLYTLNGYYAAYEPAFKGSFIRSSSASPGGFNPSSGLPSPTVIRNADNYSTDIAGTLPTGLTYDLSGPLTRQTGNVIPPSSEYSAQPTIRLSQPLLKNFWIDNTRFQIQLSKAQLKFDEWTLRLKIMTVVTSVKNAYYNLIAAREQVKVFEQALHLAEQLVAENRKRVAVGALAPLDEKQSESQAASAKADLLQGLQNLATQENVLKSLLTENFSEWADVAPIPAEPLVVVPEPLNLQESWRRGIAQRPEMQQAKLAVEKENITVKYGYNQLFPEVDLTGSYGHAALDPNFTDTLGDIRDGKFPSYTYGVVVTIPLGNTAARNSYKSSKASVKQTLLQLKQQEQNIVIAIDNDVKVVQSDLQRVDATREARIYAEAALEAEQKKLENGKSTSFVVLQLQSNLTSARSAEIQAQASYNIALEQLALDEGNTLQRNHIDLNIK